MKLLLLALLIIFPYLSFSQDFKVKVGGSEFPTDKISDHVTFPERVKQFSIKKENADSIPSTYIIQIGEEEHSFPADGAYHVVEFSHDVRDLVVYILDEKRSIQGKPFILKKPK